MIQQANTNYFSPTTYTWLWTYGPGHLSFKYVVPGMHQYVSRAAEWLFCRQGGLVMIWGDTSFDGNVFLPCGCGALRIKLEGSKLSIRTQNEKRALCCTAKKGANIDSNFQVLSTTSAAYIVFACQIWLGCFQRGGAVTVMLAAHNPCADSDYIRRRSKTKTKRC